MNIQWFPGHMAKARRHIVEKLKLIDVVWEVVDARLPLSSRNPLLDELSAGKQRLLLINKCDLADPTMTTEWERFFADRTITTVLVNGQTGAGAKEVRAKSLQLMEPTFAVRQQRGIVSRRVRAMIVGVPNAGKSALINRLASRNAAETGDRPGVTKREQWIKIGGELELLDTPGILWPKFTSPEVGFRLAISGAIKSELLQAEELAVELLQFLAEHYFHNLQERYGLETIEEPVEMLEQVAAKRGCVGRGGIADYERAAKIVLEDFKSGRLGRVTLESPGPHANGL